MRILLFRLGCRQDGRGRSLWRSVLVSVRQLSEFQE